MDIEIKEGYGNLKDIKVLFQEYTSWLGIDLSYQNYTEEYLCLPGKYAKPDGRLYIAYVDGMAAGCIGLRKLDTQKAEIKRLYVRTQVRGLHIGRLLAEQVVQEAKAIGYQSIVLDTLFSMESARGLYKSLGFIETPPYYETPVPDTCFLYLAL